MWAVPDYLLSVTGSLVLLPIGVPPERLLGMRRWLVTTVVSRAGSIVPARTLCPLIRYVWSVWSPYLVHALI